MEATFTSKYMTVKQWVETYGYIPEGGLRHLIFHNKDFEKKVVRRLGRKVILDVEALEAYVNEQGSNPQSSAKDSKDSNEISNKKIA